jgi:hypothetical protein
MTLSTRLSASDLEYIVQNNPATASNPSAYSTASFTTKSLLQLGSQCTADQGVIGIIAQPSTNPNTSRALRVGNYYYTFSSSQSSCSASVNANNIELSQTALLRQAFTTISNKK